MRLAIVENDLITAIVRWPSDQPWEDLQRQNPASEILPVAIETIGEADSDSTELKRLDPVIERAGESVRRPPIEGESPEALPTAIEDRVVAYHIAVPIDLTSDRTSALRGLIASLTAKLFGETSQVELLDQLLNGSKVDPEQAAICADYASRIRVARALIESANSRSSIRDAVENALRFDTVDKPTTA